MKLFTVLAFAAAAIASAMPSNDGPVLDLEAFDKFMDKFLVARDPISSCDTCNEHWGTCISYGMAGNDNQMGCEAVCKNHICRKFPDCKQCNATRWPCHPY